MEQLKRYLRFDSSATRYNLGQLQVVALYALFEPNDGVYITPNAWYRIGDNVLTRLQDGLSIPFHYPTLQALQRGDLIPVCMDGSLDTMLQSAAMFWGAGLQQAAPAIPAAPVLQVAQPARNVSKWDPNAYYPPLPGPGMSPLKLAQPEYRFAPTKEMKDLYYMRIEAAIRQCFVADERVASCSYEEMIGFLLAAAFYTLFIPIDGAYITNTGTYRIGESSIKVGLFPNSINPAGFSILEKGEKLPISSKAALNNNLLWASSLVGYPKLKFSHIEVPSIPYAERHPEIFDQD